MPPVVRLLPLIVFAGCGPSPATPAAAPAGLANVPAVVVTLDFPADKPAVCEAVPSAGSAAARTYRRTVNADFRLTLQPLEQDGRAFRVAFTGRPASLGNYQVRFTPGEDGTVTMAETLGRRFDSKTLTIVEGAWEDLEHGGRVVLLGGEPEDGGETLRESLSFTAANAVRAHLPDAMPKAGGSTVTVGGDVRQRVVLTAEQAEIGYAGELWASVVLWEQGAAAPQPTNSATTRTVPSANRTR